jgi:hypothetical protein
VSSERPTNFEAPSANDPAAQAFASAETFRPWSSNRNEGIIWSERLFAQASSAAGDAARFAAKL